MSQNATFTLRQHTTKVTNLIVCPLTDTHVSPQLLSSDEAGQVICWNLITRRPMWHLQIESNATIIDLQLIQGKYLCVLSRDYTLRIYELEQRDKILFQMNVNTLNFANLAIYMVDHAILRLHCCNTQDSELLDVYEINLTTGKLSRTFNKLDFFPILQKLFPNNDSITKLDKLGMIMKFCSVASQYLVFIGYESGVVLGLKYLEIKDNEPVLKIVYISVMHLPEPILELKLTNDEKFVLSSSTSNQIGKHPIISLSTDTVGDFETNGEIIYSPNLSIMDPEIITVKGQKISHIASNTKYLIWATWQGKTFLMDKDQKNVLAKWVKFKSSIQPNESSQGNLNKSSQDVKMSKNIKIGSMTVLENDKYQALKRLISIEDSKMKQLISLAQQRRINQFVESSWCFIGYEDGSIALHKL